jgi:hypothetical protein
VWIEFSAPGIVRLPVHYNHAVQGLIYRFLPHEYRKTLHDDGYVVGKRRLKLFTFSRIFGMKDEGKAGLVAFRPPIEVRISSPVEKFLSELINQLMKTPKLQLLVTSSKPPLSRFQGVLLWARRRSSTHFHPLLYIQPCILRRGKRRPTISPLMSRSLANLYPSTLLESIGPIKVKAYRVMLALPL